MPPTDIVVTAQALPFPDAAVQRGYGPLRLTGLWRLSSPSPAFGGISALSAGEGGAFMGIDDSGEHVAFTLGGRGAARIAALPRLPKLRDEPNWKQDSESMARDPATGRVWVGFERVQRICRYAPGFARIERCASPAGLRDWPEEGGAESLVRFADGRFLALGERANGAGGGFDVLLWAGDPVEASTPTPVHLTYRAPTGYRPTDALWLGGDRLLVMNRRYTMLGQYSANLALVRLPRLAEGAVLKGEVIADFSRTGPTDNLEALALGHDEAGAPVLWIASDDNRFFLQKTLLFRFALPKDWVSAIPAP